MSPCSKHLRVERKCQPWPSGGKLRELLDVPLCKLRKQLEGEKGLAYAYIVRTVKPNKEVDADEFCQTGSAPNFQGDRMTLFTCKHKMRTSSVIEELIRKRKPLWIAGFTGASYRQGRNYLFFLMKVGKSYTSQHSAWKSLREARNAKCTCRGTLSKFGDMYKPKEGLRCDFDPSDYEPPDGCHAHASKGLWHKDISYVRFMKEHGSSTCRRSAVQLSVDQTYHSIDQPRTGP